MKPRNWKIEFSKGYTRTRSLYASVHGSCHSFRNLFPSIFETSTGQIAHKASASENMEMKIASSRQPAASSICITWGGKSSTGFLCFSSKSIWSLCFVIQTLSWLLFWIIVNSVLLRKLLPYWWKNEVKVWEPSLTIIMKIAFVVGMKVVA